MFTSAPILVVGDVAIDEMIYGDTARLSREAPVLILRHSRTDVVLGAAGNAAHNLAKLGANTHLVSICGDDYNASRLRSALLRDGIHPEGLVTDVSRPTPTKTRISGTANHSVTQQIVRIDTESHAPVNQTTEAQLIHQLISLAPTLKGILLSDYGMGTVTPNVINTIRHLVKQYNLIWAVDSQCDLRQFHGATFITPNQPEAEQNLGFPLDSDEAVHQGGQRLLQQTGSEYLLITLGQRGMALFSHQQDTPFWIPAFNKSDVFDVTGAGDTVIATMTLALASGLDIQEAVIWGNLAASLVVRKFGAATTSQAELLAAQKTLPEEFQPLLKSDRKATSPVVIAPPAPVAADTQ